MQRALKHTDLVAAGGILLVVVMMVVPLPSALLDLFITINIAAALAIVVATLYVPRALDFAAFPSLLLLTTLFRLAINISVTRLILLEGDAGHVVKAFGDFVVGGNVVVGLIIFLVLVVIQFMVVTKGSERVAEVGARFTLDAMPGKQMAIDADLNAGQITEEEAKRRRDEIAQEADFYGSMDGAAKFVKGDAIAAVIITFINLIGGMVVGVAQQGMSFGESAAHFSLLTVGDGLSAQIPALLISVATGIIVTRSASSNGDLGSDIAGQILAQRRAPMIAGCAMCAMALVPGLPKGPFLIIGVGLVLLARSLPETAPTAAAAGGAPGAAPADAAALAAGTAGELPPAEQPVEALPIDPLELAVGFGLVPLVDQRAGGTLLQRVKSIRRQIAGDLGIVIPSVRIHDDLRLDSHEYVLKVRGSEVARGRLMAGHVLAMDAGEAVGRLAGIPTVEPAFGLPASWIAEDQRAEAEALGYTVVDGESVIATHLTEEIRRHADELLTRQDVRALLDRLKEHNAAVVEEVVPDLISLGELQRVLQALLHEGVSVRDLGVIVESVGDKARVTRDPSLLAEYARQALGRTITSPHLDGDLRLRALALDPVLEQEISDAIAQTADGEFLAMDPMRAQALVDALQHSTDQAMAQGARPVLLCSARVRRHLRRLVEQRLPALAVCSYNEIAPGIAVETLGVVSIEGVPA
jgi:flagellar biosynthesis protein FlhA